jgi:hypothetical protein
MRGMDDDKTEALIGHNHVLLAQAEAARAGSRHSIGASSATRAYAALLHEEAEERVLDAYLGQLRARLLLLRCRQVRPSFNRRTTS